MRRLPQPREQQAPPELGALFEHYDARVYFRAGNGMISCVFHDDRRPSLSLDLEKQLWKCQSCSRGGSAWDLIMLKEDLDFRGALSFAAALDIETRLAEGRNEDVPSGAYGLARSGSVARRKGHREGRRSWKPSWSRE